MSTVHKISIYGGSVTVYQHAGETVDVQGVPMVRLRHGTICRPDGFHSSLAEAQRDAADRLDEIREELAERAARLRQEADA